MVVVEQPPAGSRLQVAQGLAVGHFGFLVVPGHIVVIVVVAQHREYAVGRMQAGQQVAVGQGLAGLAAHQVAREADHVGIQGIDGLDLFLDDGGVPVVGAQVGIAPLHDAVAVEGVRQVGKFQFHLFHLKRARSDDSPPPHHAEHQRCHNEGTQGRPAPFHPPPDAIDRHAQRLGCQQGKEGVKHVLACDKGAVGHRRARHGQHADGDDQHRSQQGQQGVEPRCHAVAVAAQAAADVNVHGDAKHRHDDKSDPVNRHFLWLL